MAQPETVTFQEQAIYDEVTGITLTIWRTSSGEGRIRLSGALEHGNRDFQFDTEGCLAGMGTAVGPHPERLRLIC